MTRPIAYLDHAAATPMDDLVVSAMTPYFSELFYNPSSPYAQAVAARRDYDQAKSRVAATFGAKGDDIIMTAGATESINLAFSTVKDGHTVVSAIEHPAVLAAARLHDHTLVVPTKKGIVTAEAVKQSVTPETKLVSVQLANNEIGTIQPIKDIAMVVQAERQRRREAGSTTPIYFHCDASQGFSQIEVNVARLGVDMLTLNAGKIYGPKQVGLLWVKPGILITPLIVGGGQERGLRSGTENVAGAVGFAIAAELAVSRRKAEAERLSRLRDRMQERLMAAFATLVVSSHPKKCLPGSLHVSVPGIDGERIVFMLERKDILVATGSACAANKGTRSHVLAAIGLPDEAIDGSLRITLGRMTDEATIERATEAIIGAIRSEQTRLHDA